MREERATGVGRPGFRALALLLPTLALSVGNPLVLIAIPFVVLCVLAPGRGYAPIITAGILLALVLSGTGVSGMWYIERGWALLVGGAFAGATLLKPESPFLPRALLAVVMALAAAGLSLALVPGGATVVDWLVVQRLLQGTAVALEGLRMVQGDAVLSPALQGAVERAAEVQGLLFPAILALSTLAALGVAWWLYVRMVAGRSDGLGPLAQFRFDHHWVWVFIGGLVLVLWGGEGMMTRLGTNAAVFMASLYAIRGLAVVLFLKGGISALGVLLLTVGMLFLAPLILAGALVIGLGDSWFDIRRRPVPGTGRD